MWTKGPLNIREKPKGSCSLLFLNKIIQLGCISYNSFSEL